VILAQPERGLLHVEQYGYDHRLVRVIEGRTARGVYLKITRAGWVSLLDHAAYLGKELARAEAALKGGEAYVQDGA
jgi:tetrahydromethanopterin S-methyltransferase subunit A